MSIYRSQTWKVCSYILSGLIGQSIAVRHANKFWPKQVITFTQDLQQQVNHISVQFDTRSNSAPEVPAQPEAPSHKKLTEQKMEVVLGPVKQTVKLFKTKTGKGQSASSS